MDTGWIEELLRLNTRIVASETSVGAQASRIAELIEEGRDTADLEKGLMACRHQLRLLRLFRDTMLDEVEGGGERS